MSKIKSKTHKGTAKVTKVRPGGTVKIGHPGTRHNTWKKNSASNIVCRFSSKMSSGDYKRLKDVL